MNDFTTEIVQTLVTKGDLNELFRSHLEKAINTLLRTELTAFSVKIQKLSESIKYFV
ncbi:hypothetical protein [Enterococcus faecium]|uniref:hypothetical protein n=1 Tax=Enterococcus faecium TaxID=1352 RepID=UPI00220963B7|nr:hypothetical protein EfmJHP9_17560 [Enterococcus faecium]